MTGPFAAGYGDGILGRDPGPDLYTTDREREKYAEGYRYGAEDRAAGALELAERLS